MPPERRRDSEACTAFTAFWARSRVVSRCSPATCSPACRESSTSAAAAAAMSAIGLPANSSLSAILPMSAIELGAAEALEELVGDPVQRVELEDLQDEDRPGEQRGQRQTHHHHLHQRLGVDEHFPGAEVAGVRAADPGGRGLIRGSGGSVRRRRRSWRGRRSSRGGVLRKGRRRRHQRERADECENWSGSFRVKHRFASSCLVLLALGPEGIVARGACPPVMVEAWRDIAVGDLAKPEP